MIARLDGSKSNVNFDLNPLVKQEKKDHGLRYSKGKLRYSLMPPDAYQEIIRVFTKGAEKYAPRNWEKGMEWHECLEPLERHLAKWKMGYSRDEEYPDLYHMAMVAWNAIALLTYELRDIGVNDVMGIGTEYLHNESPPKQEEYDLPEQIDGDGTYYAPIKNMVFGGDKRIVPTTLQNGVDNETE